MENLQDEEWIYLDPKRNRGDYVAAISNRGRYIRVNDDICISYIRQTVRIEGVRRKVSHVIADRFLITVKRPDQNWIDHISHNPVGMYPNDVRNLRWCTHAENNTFAEAYENRCYSVRSPEVRAKMSAAKIGKTPWNKGKKCPEFSGSNNPRWNPDKEGMHKRRLEYMRKRRAAKRKAKQP